jgi:aminopeptidase N
MSGVSAGAICWFKKGITDSWKDNQATIDCLNFVDGVCCPHYDEEPERIPYVKEILVNKEINSCYAIEGYAALHLVDDKLKYNVSFGSDTGCHNVSKNKDLIEHTQIKDTVKIIL